MIVSGRQPLPALVLVGLVVVAAALLVAGFGLAVGTGLMLGVVLGLAAIGAAVLLSRRNGAWGWSSCSAAPGVADPSTNFFQEYGQRSARVADLDAGALSSVVAVGEQVTTRGVRIELVAVELRTDGGIATLVTHTRPPAEPPGHFADVHVSDDARTDYFAVGQGINQSSPSTGRVEVRFAPAPPADARTLTIEIQRFIDPFSSKEPAHVEGPWSFAVSVDPPNTPAATDTRNDPR